MRIKAAVKKDLADCEKLLSQPDFESKILMKKNPNEKITIKTISIQYKN